jgi:mono/diheme cytochrome c family protein
MGRIAAGVLSALAMVAGSSSPAWAADPAQGMKLFADQKCTLCHSVEGKGNPKGPLDGVGSKLKADEIRNWITSPKEMTEKTKATRKPPMKSFPHLTAAEVDALVAYLGTLKKK